MHTHHHRANAPNVGALHAANLEENDEIRRRFGATPIYILRQSYGEGFAPGTPGDVTLAQAIDHIDAASLHLLARRLARRGGDDVSRM